MSGSEREKIRHLLDIKEPNSQQMVPLEAATYSLGRDPSNSIVLNAKAVSRQHAILLRVTVPESNDYLFRIVDGSLKGKRSTNGLFVNGDKCSSHILRHGDIIEFGDQIKATYFTLSNLSDAEFSEACKTEDFAGVLSKSVNPFDTLVIPDFFPEESSEAALVRLASFPELNPNPVMEIDLAGSITYLNPAAILRFKDIQENGLEHPILNGLIAIVQTQTENPFVREVNIGETYFEQSVHYLAESDLIRIFISDITERKRAEIELHKRDHLLQAVAEATKNLLTEMDHERAINQALAILGEAAEVDHVYIFENHPHPVTGEMARSIRFEWSNKSVEPLITLTHWQDQAYRTLGISRWHSVLSSGRSIGGAIQDFPNTEQAIFQQAPIKSILIAPILIDHDCWGCIGFDDCHLERRWSTHEKAALFAMAASVSGALQRHQTEEMIRYRALHDLLTGLPNRMLFNEQLTLALPNAARSGDSLAVMFLDLDRFKTINDTLGHTLGDQLLQQVAQRLQKTLRAGDIIARWGGDEFTILLPQVSNFADVAKTAERLLKTLDTVFNLGGNELFVSASIGIALLDEENSDAETLIQHADVALYQAKDLGRNNYQVYTAAMGSKGPELLTIEKDLRHALERDELIVCYQPRVNIETGEINGMEALLRWQHPNMGLISPNVFIPIAEESGLILPIGEWVLRTACIQNKAWQEAGFPPVSVAVNLSPLQFRQPRLAESIAKVLEETGLAPHYLELEITETAAIQDIEFTSSVLKALNDMGVHLSIDDFGTGHSSLQRLQLLPLHNLKIDQSFVRDLVSNHKVSHIVTAIVTLGQQLGLSIVAEGVENQEQLDFLKSINCDTAQGFLLHRPISVEAATEILAAASTNACLDNLIGNHS
ncbi:MAG: EAL domain-containing protein [Leptolyngbyaceae cyanobacterium MO_188.B28]|nr:EAL domain-containing protein [Leptolyngbyaceae cyanobacterium MO_188.B28]